MLRRLAQAVHVCALPDPVACAWVPRAARGLRGASACAWESLICEALLPAPRWNECLERKGKVGK